uniref:Uncharacterized protein n=1 Tax=Pseudo-nitzschia australis TaxID=44445 RepID=A0A7S4ARZ6_9STRA
MQCNLQNLVLGDDINRNSVIDCNDRNNNCCYDDVNFEDVDNMIAKQFHSLPVQYRNNINEEIHGVKSMSRDETPELIQTSLMQLEIELQNLPMYHRLIYLKACSMEMQSNINKKITLNDSFNEMGTINADKNHISLVSPHLDDECNHPSSTQPDLPASSNATTSLSFCYVKCREFQLTFLRCEFFDAKKAAMRLVKYLELAYKVCGEEALRRPLRVDDIDSSEEFAVFRASNQRLLPFRDKSGRRVLVINTDLSLASLSQSIDPKMRVLLYLWSVLMEDIDAQRRGLVVIFWPRQVKNQRTQTYHEETDEDMSILTANSNGRSTYRTKCKKVKLPASDYSDAGGIIKQAALVPPNGNPDSIWKQFFEAIPIRMCAIHICLPDDEPYCEMIRCFFLLAIGEDHRTRVKAHHGELSPV